MDRGNGIGNLGPEYTIIFASDYGNIAHGYTEAIIAHSYAHDYAAITGIGTSTPAFPDCLRILLLS